MKVTEKTKTAGVIICLIILLISTIYLIFEICFNKNNPTEPIIEKPNHLGILLKNDGVLSLYNIKEDRYIDNISISKKEYPQYQHPYDNPYKILSTKKGIIVANPGSNELIFYKENNNKLTEKIRKTFEHPIKHLKASNDIIAVTLMKENKVSIYNYDFKLLDSFSFKHDIDSIEVHEKSLYVSSNKYVYDCDKKGSKAIYTGDSNISLFKSNDNNIYAGNIFATEKEKSVLFKLDTDKNKVISILELTKEYPINIFENNDFIFVTCKGILDSNKDGIIVVDKTSFTIEKVINTEESPIGSTLMSNNAYIYVNHEDGSVYRIDINNDLKVEKAFTINNLKALYVTDYFK